MLWAQLCLWLAQGPLLALTLTPQLFQDHLPHRQLHPCSKQEGGRLNAASTHTWSRTISAFLLCLHSSSPYHPCPVCGLFGRHRHLHIQPLHHEPGRDAISHQPKNTDTAQPSPETKKRSGAKLVQAKQQNDTKAEWRQRKQDIHTNV